MRKIALAIVTLGLVMLGGYLVLAQIAQNRPGAAVAYPTNRRCARLSAAATRARHERAAQGAG